jgi:SAM-dependent methyltransferase
MSGGSPGERWDERYRATPRLFRADPDESLVELVAPLAPGRAADLGAGEGRNSVWLARHGWTVVAVDASEVALARLADAAAMDGVAVEGVVDDLLGFLHKAAARHDTFDLVVVAFVHPEPGEREALLRAAAGSVSAGGHLFVVAHHRGSPSVAHRIEARRLYTEEDLRKVEPPLEVLRLEGRSGESDITEPGIDIVLWARRPPLEEAAPPQRVIVAISEMSVPVHEDLDG